MDDLKTGQQYRFRRARCGAMPCSRVRSTPRISKHASGSRFSRRTRRRLLSRATHDGGDVFDFPGFVPSPDVADFDHVGRKLSPSADVVGLRSRAQSDPALAGDARDYPGGLLATGIRYASRSRWRVRERVGSLLMFVSALSRVGVSGDFGSCTLTPAQPSVRDTCARRSEVAHGRPDPIHTRCCFDVASVDSPD